MSKAITHQLGQAALKFSPFQKRATIAASICVFLSRANSKTNSFKMLRAMVSSVAIVFFRRNPFRDRIFFLLPYGRIHVTLHDITCIPGHASSGAEVRSGCGRFRCRG